MNLTIRVLGLEVLSIHADTEDEAGDDDYSLGGTTASTAMGFTPTMVAPADDPGTE